MILWQHFGLSEGVPWAKAAGGMLQMLDSFVSDFHFCADPIAPQPFLMWCENYCDTMAKANQCSGP